MSTQTTFYPTDPSLDSSVAPECLLLGHGFPPEFFSLSLLEKGMHRQDMGMPPMHYQSNQIGPEQAAGSVEDTDTNQQHLGNRPPTPASQDSRKESMNSEMNQAPPYLKSYPAVPNFSSFSCSSSGSGDRDQEFVFDHNRVSPHSDISSNKSTSPLRWQSGNTDKRAKHLERNRAAASKSRQKKKRETDQLRNRFQEVSRRRSRLEDEIKHLHSQLLSLKDQILMHSRCDDEAIHLYLGRMVKQATQHDSISSGSGSAPDDDDTHSYGQAPGSGSPSHNAMAGLHGHAHHFDHNQSEVDLANSRHLQMRMGDARGLPCGVERPMMNQMFTQAHDGNIFDLQISIG